MQVRPNVTSTHLSLGSRNETIHELPMLPIESRGGHFTCGLLLVNLYKKDLNSYACILVHLVGYYTTSNVEGIACLTSTEGRLCVRSTACSSPVLGRVHQLVACMRPVRVGKLKAVHALS